MSKFIHDCIECQQNKHINQKLQTASIQTFSENASYFNYRISMDTKGPINPPVTAACLYPALRLDKLYAALIRCLVLWTVTKQFLVFRVLKDCIF